MAAVVAQAIEIPPTRRAAPGLHKQLRGHRVACQASIARLSTAQIYVSRCGSPFNCSVLLHTAVYQYAGVRGHKRHSCPFRSFQLRRHTPYIRHSRRRKIHFTWSSIRPLLSTLRTKKTAATRWRGVPEVR